MQVFGTWIKPRSGQTHQTAVEKVESQIGRKLTLDHTYVHMPTLLPNDVMKWDAQGGRVPLVAWDPDPKYTWTQVAQGAADSYIDQQAKSLKAWGFPCWLNFGHEPENDTGMGTSTDFVAAFNRIVDRFNAIGVPNVKHIVCLISWTITSGAGNKWLPSKAEIIGVDGYNYYGVQANKKYRNVSDIFGPALKFARANGKPLAIIETGTTDAAGDPQGWMLRARDYVLANPDIAAFVYFSSDNAYPWWHDESPEKLAGFKALAGALQ